jgi:hypothetical protein
VGLGEGPEPEFDYALRLWRVLAESEQTDHRAAGRVSVG